MSLRKGSESSKQPLVSIGVPVFNGERYLALALQAIANQTFSDFEVLISDNGSTDATRDICKRFVELDDRFQYFPQTMNRGASWNFNQVVNLAKGEYFKWATDDDLIESTFLERCVETLDNAPETVALCYPRTALIDADGHLISGYEDNLDLRQSSPSARFRMYLVNHELSNVVHGLHRTESLRRTRLLGNYHSSDLVLLSEIVLGGQIWEISDRLFMRRWHDGMSRLANVTDKAVTEWFDPTKTDSRIMPRTRLYVENVRSILRMSMPAKERFRCLVALFAVWTPRYWRVVGGEFKSELFGWVRRLPVD